MADILVAVKEEQVEEEKVQVVHPHFCSDTEFDW
jgi:hypothetical protein